MARRTERLRDTDLLRLDAARSGCGCTMVPACAFPDGTYCACATQCSGTPEDYPWLWTCDAAYGTAPGCPLIPPNDGAGCTNEGAKCVYGVCSANLFLSADCVNGAWLLGEGPAKY